MVRWLSGCTANVVCGSSDISVQFSSLKAAGPTTEEEGMTNNAVNETWSPSKSIGSELSAGDAVEVFGLQGATELNGQRGRITRFNEESKRFGVKLSKNYEPKAIRPENLRKIPQKNANIGSSVPTGTHAESRAQLCRNPVAEEEDVSRRNKYSPGCSANRRPWLDSQCVYIPAAWSRSSPSRPSIARRLAHPAPILPQLSTSAGLPRIVPFQDEMEYPDKKMASRAIKAAIVGLGIGFFLSLAQVCRAAWFVGSFIAVQVIGAVFLTGMTDEVGLNVLCCIFGLHVGIAIEQGGQWAYGAASEDSVGPWSIIVIFCTILYLQNFWAECNTLPPDFITTISLFFPVFPAFIAGLFMSCVEFFLEWRYFPTQKLWRTSIAAGCCLLVAGQWLISNSSNAAGRNFWANCRDTGDENDPDLAGLEIPDRRVVQEGIYRWERHPAYLGAMLWGLGAQLVLCNPLMFVFVGFVLWATLLHVALEEESELYDEFKGTYTNYSSLTRCWIPLFEGILENAAFMREMSDNAPETGPDDTQDSDMDNDDSEGCGNEEDLLPTWEGVPKGGALWNRQFKEPWLLG